MTLHYITYIHTYIHTGDWDSLGEQHGRQTAHAFGSQIQDVSDAQ
jgi:hypothetical protein